MLSLVLFALKKGGWFNSWPSAWCTTESYLLQLTVHIDTSPHFPSKMHTWSSGVMLAIY